jgi:integrase
MPRKGKRITIARGIYRDGTEGPYEVRVTVGGQPYLDRMPPDSTDEELKQTRARLELEGRTETPRATRGSLAADAPRYLRLIKHLESWKDREAHLTAWIARYGSTPRHRLTAADVLAARVGWLTQKKPMAPKTINHRVDTLRHLYRTLDGKRKPTPCDDVTPLHVPKTPIRRISNELLLRVDQNLQRMEVKRIGRPMSAKTRARFRVFVSTGKRPCEIMRARPGDVDLEARVWVPRDAKGGFCPGVYLNADQRAAWQLFVAADAWGPYSTGAFARTLRSAGWPAGVRPYQARHTTWITASERGIDLEDIAVGAGHRDPRTTRRAYVPVLNSRLQRLGEVLDGRFQGWPSAEVAESVVPTVGTGRKRKKA